MDTVERILAHHGVKGMKWGVRRSRQPVVAKSKKGHETAISDDAKRANQHRGTAHTKGTAALSNKDLQDLVNRMNLEQQFSRLANEKSTLQRGHDQVKQVLGVANTLQQVHSFVNGPAGKAIKVALAG